MNEQINLLHQRSKNITEKLKQKYLNNKREIKIVKMLEHFNDRLEKLRGLNKEKSTDQFLCSFILSDLKEMIIQIEQLVKTEV